MKFAIVNGARQEAQPGHSGTCPACALPMMAKCGEVKLWHWAHKGRRVCDHWWENETEWHRAWKDEFPMEWQEIPHIADSGERHIADVKTNHGWVIEIQHSYLKPEERRARDDFYQKLIWIVDGMRRKTDANQFRSALKNGISIASNAPIRKVHPEDSSLLMEWSKSRAPVFFDFGPGPTLWWLLGRGASGYAYVAPFNRSELLAIHRDGATQAESAFYTLVNDLGKLIANHEAQLPSLR